MNWHWKEKNDYVVIREIEEREGRPFDEIVKENWERYKKSGSKNGKLDKEVEEDERKEG